MHPGPIIRGLELTAEVADCPQSVIVDEVRNGVPTRMAILARALGKAVRVNFNATDLRGSTGLSKLYGIRESVHLGKFAGSCGEDQESADQRRARDRSGGKIDAPMDRAAARRAGGRGRCARQNSRERR